MGIAVKPSLLFFSVYAAVMSAAEAAPMTFKCTTAEGTPAADLVVDLERMTMSWGYKKYTIHSVNESYISAYEQVGNEVGGEVWVLDRNSGEYFRAGVNFGWPTAADAIKHRTPGEIGAQTYSGRCSRPLL